MNNKHGQSTHDPCKNLVDGKECASKRYAWKIKDKVYRCRKCGTLTDKTATPAT